MSPHVNSALDWTDRVLELQVDAVAHGGHCVARHDGRVVFVRHALPGFPNIDTPQNTSLAFALGYVVVIFVLMWLLYAARIFVKV